MMSSSYESLESFEESDDAQPVTAGNFKLLTVDKGGRRIGRNEIACLDVTIGGCRFEAGLRLDGSLALPPGVAVPPELRKHAREVAQRMALADLAKVWAKQSEPGELG